PGRVVGKRPRCGGRNDGRTGEIGSRRRTGILRRPARPRQRTRGGAAVTSKKTYIRIGLFVVVLTTALIWGTLWLSAGGAPGEFDFYTTYMNESVSGLSPDAALTYRGVNVGKVREITIDPNNPNRVRLLLQVKHGVPIKQDTEATLAMQGLTGLATIDLLGG